MVWPDFYLEETTADITLARLSGNDYSCEA